MLPGPWASEVPSGQPASETRAGPTRGRADRIRSVPAPEPHTLGLPAAPLWPPRGSGTVPVVIVPGTAGSPFHCSRSRSRFLCCARRGGGTVEARAPDPAARAALPVQPDPSFVRDVVGLLPRNPADGFELPEAASRGPQSARPWRRWWRRSASSSPLTTPSGGPGRRRPSWRSRRATGRRAGGRPGHRPISWAEEIPRRRDRMALAPAGWPAKMVSANKDPLPARVRVFVDRLGRRTWRNLGLGIKDYQTSRIIAIAPGLVCVTLPLRDLNGQLWCPRPPPGLVQKPLPRSCRFIFKPFPIGNHAQARPSGFPKNRTASFVFPRKRQVSIPSAVPGNPPGETQGAEVATGLPCPTRHRRRGDSANCRGCPSVRSCKFQRVPAPKNDATEVRTFSVWFCKLQRRVRNRPSERRLQIAGRAFRVSICLPRGVGDTLFSEGGLMSGFILTACQRKGGIGRSTLLYNLAGAMSKRGLRTLLVDLDPQASITQICLGPEVVDTLRSTAGRLADRRRHVRDRRVDHPAQRHPRRGPRTGVEHGVPV